MLPKERVAFGDTHHPQGRDDRRQSGGDDDKKTIIHSPSNPSLAAVARMKRSGEFEREFRSDNVPDRKVPEHGPESVVPLVVPYDRSSAKLERKRAMTRGDDRRTEPAPTGFVDGSVSREFCPVRRQSAPGSF